MEEKKSWLNVQVTGMVGDKEIDAANYEGSGVIVLVDTGENVACGTLGAWGPVEVATAIGCIKKNVGVKMFKDALGLLVVHEMTETSSKISKSAAEEAENEKRAAEAAGEVQHGEEP